jgi:VCBS repeat-containing protein
MTRALLTGVTGFLLLFPLVPTAVAQPSPPLQFFKNYFVTGDYVVGGVGLRGLGEGGLATGTIEISDVPAGADILAAFLYWQVVSTTAAGPDSGSLPVKFRGYPLASAAGPFGKVLASDGTAPCWASGGGTGSSGGSKRTYTYRADVLRYFDVDAATGRLAVNGPHEVSLPDSGSNGNATPLALGASLLIVYRQSTLPLSAVVIYDGGYTLDNSTGSMVQAIEGFYQPGAAAAKMTHIVGSGQANKAETLLFNGTPIATDPFGGFAGDSWDNPTFDGLDLGTAPDTVAAVTTAVSPASDCLTWGAVVFKTEVKDTDGDGLLDIWETSSSLTDPHGTPLPNLAAMGADPGQKDLFVEVGYMYANDDADGNPPTYGGVPTPAHSHLPGHEALKLVGDAFANAPTGRINVHFDVGADYPSGEADPYIIRGAGLARGGEGVDERVTLCTRGETDPPWVCQYSEWPGTIGWKTGFRFLRDDVLRVTPTPPPTTPPTPLEDYCDQPGYTCERRFDSVRKDIFRYVLFAHQIGLPKSEEPCLDASGTAVPVNPATLRCDAPLRDNPDFHVPRTNTGVGDFPGGDAMVTLGAFNDHDGLPGGTPFMQASTLMHELGHTLERRHGGEAFEPNCKPTYLSVMNYLYQLRGLLDDRGVPFLDFSGNAYAGAPVDETSLTDGFLAALPYRIGWYAPLAGSYLEADGAPARRHCDGSDLLPTDVPMVRIDAGTSAGPIDWDADGDTTETAFALDVNFNGRLDGTPGPPLVGSDDWSALRFDQVGGRRNTGGLFVADPSGLQLVGPLSLGVGRGDLGAGDLARGDLGGGRGDLGGGRGDLGGGRGDLGWGDLDRGDLGGGRGDLGGGRGDLGGGRGDLGRGDLGGGDLFVGNPYKEGELDAETAGDLARTPPHTFEACVIGGDGPDGCAGQGTPLHRVRLDWFAPHVGGVLRYEVVRVEGEGLQRGQPWTTVATVPQVRGQRRYSAIDGSALADGARYTYFAVAVYGDGVRSDPSNIVTITGVNDPPSAADDAYSVAEDGTLTVPAPGVLGNDGDADSEGVVLTAVRVSGPAHGTVVLNADGSFTYTPAADYNGPDAFAYKATDGSLDTNVATVRITVRPVNDAPVAVDDAFATAEDTPLTGHVLGNDSDVDRDHLTAVLVAGPAQAAAFALNADGTFAYTPRRDYAGPDAFTYRASDGTVLSNVATVTLSVTPVNDTPTAVDDTYSTPQGVVLTVAAPGVLGNDSDVDGTITAALVSGPTGGAVALNANGSFTYTPSPGFSGTDTFTYRATDGTLSSTATVRIDVTRLVYGFVGVQNLPPPSGKAFNVGSAVPLRWRFTINGVVVDSANALPRITIYDAVGASVYTGTPQDPGSSSFQPPTAANGFTWQFNWQTKDLTAGRYSVYVGSDLSGQTFPTPPTTGGGFIVTLK